MPLNNRVKGAGQTAKRVVRFSIIWTSNTSNLTLLLPPPLKHSSRRAVNSCDRLLPTTG